MEIATGETIPNPPFDPDFIGKVPGRPYYDKGLHLPEDVTEGYISLDKVRCGIFLEQFCPLHHAVLSVLKGLK